MNRTRCLSWVVAALCLASSAVVATPQLPLVPYEMIECRLLHGDKCGDKVFVVEGIDSSPAAAPRPTNSQTQRINLPAIEFEFGSHRLSANARPQVAHLAKALALESLRPYVFAVQGHTDSVGDPSYNRALSLKRAREVKGYLVANGVDEHRLVEVGLGEAYPASNASRADEQEDRRNRRVEIVRIGSVDMADSPKSPRPNIRRRALLIGIDAYRHVHRLIGPVSDANAMREFVTRYLGFDARDVRLLLDAEATRARILREMEEWLIDDTRPGDEVFIYFSGHGFRQVDTNGDEADRFDETIVPVDVFVRDDDTIAGMITDDEIAVMLGRLSRRHVNVIVDACHSGTSDKAWVVRGEGWRYIKSPRRPDGGTLHIGTVDEGRAATPSTFGTSLSEPVSDAFLSTKDPGLGTADVTVWAAVEAHQKALVDEEARGAPMSVFTRRLLSGAKDREADADADGIVTRSELYAYVRRESEAYCHRNRHRCEGGLTPQIHGATGAMDAPAFAPVTVSPSATARFVKDILVGPAPDTGVVRTADTVQLRIEQGTRIAIGTEANFCGHQPARR